MPSKGTARYTFRLPTALVQHVEFTRSHRNNHTRNAPWTLSDFVREALAEKCWKMNRSRKSHYRARPTRPPNSGTTQTLAEGGA